MLQTGIGRVATFLFIPHPCAIGATCVGLLIVCSTGMPCKTDEDGSNAAVIVTFLFQNAGNVLANSYCFVSSILVCID